MEQEVSREEAKQSYEAPAITDYGTAAELTQGSCGSWCSE